MYIIYMLILEKLKSCFKESSVDALMNIGTMVCCSLVFIMLIAGLTISYASRKNFTIQDCKVDSIQSKTYKMDSIAPKIGLDGHIIVQTEEKDFEFHSLGDDCKDSYCDKPKAIITEREDNPTHIELETFVITYDKNDLFSLLFPEQREYEVVEVRLLH